MNTISKPASADQLAYVGANTLLVLPEYQDEYAAGLMEDAHDSLSKLSFQMHETAFYKRQGRAAPKSDARRRTVEDLMFVAAVAEYEELQNQLGISDPEYMGETLLECINDPCGVRDNFLIKFQRVLGNFGYSEQKTSKEYAKAAKLVAEAHIEWAVPVKPEKTKDDRPVIYGVVDKVFADVKREISDLDLNTKINKITKRSDFDHGVEEYVAEAIANKTVWGKIAARKAVQESSRNMKAANRPNKRRNKDAPPEIDLDVLGHRSASNLAYKVMTDQGDSPSLFHNGGRLVDIREDENGNIRMEEVNPSRFKANLEEQIDFMKDAKNVQAPQALANMVYNKPLTGYSRLTRITAAPTYTADKSLVVDPGYHAESGLFHRPKTGVNIPAVPQQPTDEDVKNARTELTDLFGDFPLDSLSREELVDAVNNGDDVPSFCHALSVALTPICRDMIDGPTPNHLARKDKPRTGATKIMGVASYIGTLEYAVPQSLPDSRAEVQKTIVATLDGGGNYVFFDNLPAGQENESDELSAAVTAWPHYTGRRLGQTAMVTIMVKQTWLTTGNRTQLSEQLAERTLLIDLDPKMENPGTRPTSSFEYNLDKHVPANAGKYIFALLVLVQNWISKKCPEWKGQALGGFESHATVIGGILDKAGINGFMKNRDKLKSVVQSENPETEFLDALIEEHHAAPKGCDGTLFRAWSDESPPKKTKNGDEMKPFKYAGYRVASMRDVLNREHIAQERWGYVVDEDGNISYPDKARKIVSQKVASMTGTVREWRESQTEEKMRQGRYILQKVHSDKHGALYRLEHLPFT